MNEETVKGSAMSMLDIIGITEFSIQGKVYTDAALDALSIDELEDLKIKVDAATVELGARIQARERVTPDEMERGDIPVESFREWYSRSKGALAEYRRFVPYLSSLIRRRRRAAKSIESYFMDVARETMVGDDFGFILLEAKARQDKDKSDPAQNIG